MLQREAWDSINYWEMFRNFRLNTVKSLIRTKTGKKKESPRQRVAGARRDLGGLSVRSEEDAAVAKGTGEICLETMMSLVLS